MQSKKSSFAEGTANAVVGYFLTLIIQWVLFPIFGIHANIGENIALSAMFTASTFVRSYVISRIFNRIERWNNER